MAAPVTAVRAACAVLALCAWVPIASAQEVPPPAYQLAAQRAGIPSPVLFAVALQESGARLHGRLIPWPWTLNVAGQAERYATRAEACAGLRFLIASIAFGVLYSVLIYRSYTRRTLFIVASIILPMSSGLG